MLHCPQAHILGSYWLIDGTMFIGNASLMRASLLLLVLAVCRTFAWSGQDGGWGLFPLYSASNTFLAVISSSQTPMDKYASFQKSLLMHCRGSMYPPRRLATPPAFTPSTVEIHQQYARRCFNFTNKLRPLCQPAQQEVVIINESPLMDLSLFSMSSENDDFQCSFFKEEVFF
jgi:hypothetical protein